MAGTKGNSKRTQTGAKSSGGTSSRGRGRRGSNGGSRIPQIILASVLAVTGLLFIPLLVENAVPWLGSVRGTVQGVLGLGSYLAPALLLGLAALLVLSLGRRGFRLHWARGVGWLAFFVGVLGLLHRFGGFTAANPAASTGGNLGRFVFEATSGLVGEFLAVLALLLLVAGGFASGLGLPVQQSRAFLRASRQLGRWTVRFIRWSGPAGRRALRAIGNGSKRAGALAARLGQAAGRGARRAGEAIATAYATLTARLSPPQLDEPDEAENEPAPELTTVAAAPTLPQSRTFGNGASLRTVSSTGTATPAICPNENGDGWNLPPLALLAVGAEPETNPLDDEERLKALARTIEKTLIDFGVPVKVVERRPGPTVTQFGVEPQFHEKRARDGTVLRREKVKVREITARSNDLALALAARSIRIEAPVPGRPVVGIEVPNQATSIVTLRSELENRAFQKALAKYALPIVLGRDVSGEVVTADLARMPHVLIAGATGSGKSVCINSIIVTLLMNHTPDSVRMLMIDPKRVELTLFDSIPHLLRPVVVDVEKAVPALFQAVAEMDRRYREFAALGVRNIEGYNRMVQRDSERKRLPYLVIVIDELADLMMLAADEVERTLCRLAQLARATGIHLVVATQRPSVDVVTGLIKANFPTRISFMVTSQVDSRTIIDAAGAEKLLGRGDMLFLPSDAPKPLRLQGTFLSDKEIEDLTAFWRAQRTAQYAPEFVDLPAWAPGGDEGDELYDKAVELAHEHGSISISFLQRRLRVGWNRAARLMDMLEENGELSGGERAERDEGERDETI
ncbi:MAG: DNA translocase FtsK [Chloroflexota bacterium]